MRRMLPSSTSSAAIVLAAFLAWSPTVLAQETTAPPPPAPATPTEQAAPPPAAAPEHAAPADQAAPPERRHRRRHHEESSSGRDFDLLWIGAEGGLSIVDLKMISYDELLPREIDVKETGPAFGFAAGIKVKILSVGLHLAVGKFTDFDVWALNLDGQLRIPLGFLEPYLRLGIGYAFLGSFAGRVDMQGVDVDGWDLQAGFGLDLYPSDYFSFGGGVDFTVLNLSRTDSVTAVDLTQDGAAVGVAVFVQAKAALHF